MECQPDAKIQLYDIQSNVVVCRFAFRRKFTRVVSFRSHQTRLVDTEISVARWSLFAHAEHDCLARIFQLLDGVSFSSRQPLFTNKTRLMKPAMRRARRSEDLPLTLL
ncbi:hypothetical protein T12_8603 [Trichinella patagoniensis]|uniref:Uncharacterized protein n=1 Tax=Trichinella patagoniensis TaxID=990121 RepID=A0A0V0ZSA2_9BILA|nr:hypothetical protein T12_8603 [Trichinella patagoniensis]